MHINVYFLGQDIKRKVLQKMPHSFYGKLGQWPTHINMCAFGCIHGDTLSNKMLLLFIPKEKIRTAKIQESFIMCVNVKKK